LKNLHPSTEALLEVKNENFEVLNGIYKNYQDTVFGKIRHSPYRAVEENDLSLMTRLFVLLPDNKGFYHDAVLEIEFISKRVARIKAYRNDSIFFTKNLPIKFTNEYFYVNPRAYVMPFFPLYYVRNFERVRISQYEGNLIVDHTKILWGFALMAGG